MGLIILLLRSGPSFSLRAASTVIAGEAERRRQERKSLPVVNSTGGRGVYILSSSSPSSSALTVEAVRRLA